MGLPYEDCNCPRCVDARGSKAAKRCGQCGMRDAMPWSRYCSDSCSVAASPGYRKRMLGLVRRIAS